MFSEQLLRLGAEAGRPYKKHKREEPYVSETLVFRVEGEEKPETGLVQEWFGTAGHTWLGLAHCNDRASEQAAIEALRTKPTCCR